MAGKLMVESDFVEKGVVSFLADGKTRPEGEGTVEYAILVPSLFIIGEKLKNGKKC